MRGEEIAYRGQNERGEEGLWFVNVEHYPDHSPLIKERPKRVDNILLRPRSMLALMAGLFWVDALKERNCLVIDNYLTLPFVPGARQDRLNDEGDYLFTAKSIAKLINDRNFPNVIILDPHSDVIAGMIDRCSPIHVDRIFNTQKNYDVIIAPDAGSEKRAGRIAKKYNRPLLHAWKSRDISTGKITGFGLEARDVAGKNVLVVDDICDGGGTFVGLGEVLKARKANADLYVTHGLFTQGIEKLKNYYDKLICTDSVVLDRRGVEVIPIAQNDLV